MRMENLPSKPFSGNTLSMRINRVLDDYSIVYTWHGTKDWVNPTKDQLRREGALSDEARRNNTTRGFTPGLIDLSRGEQGGRIPLPESEGRSQTVKRQGRKTASTAARARKGKSKRPSIIVVDELEDQPWPEFEIDYIAKSQEKPFRDGDFDNQSAISDGSYPPTEFHHAALKHQGLVDLRSSEYVPIMPDQTSLADATRYATQNHGEFIDLESSDVHSNMPCPTIEMDNDPQHYPKVTNFGSSDGRSYTSSDVMLPRQGYQSSSSSVVLENQHSQVHQLNIPVEHYQQYADFPDHNIQLHTEIPDHNVQSQLFPGMEFQDKATLPTMVFPDSNPELDPNLQMFNIQDTSNFSLYHTQHKSDFSGNYNQDLGGYNINSDAQLFEPHGNFQLSGNQPTAPTIGFETQSFESNASFRPSGKRPGSPLMGFRASPFNPSAGFQSFGDLSTAPVIGFEASPFNSEESFDPFNIQGATTSENFVNPDAFETLPNLQLSDIQLASSSVDYTSHPDYELQSGFNISDNQSFPASSPSVAQTPFGLDLIEQNSDNNPYTFEEPVNYPEGNGSLLEDLMFNHENLWNY